MRIDHVSQPYRIEAAKKAGVTKKKAGASKKAGDQVQFSEDGKFLSSTRASVEVAKAKISSTPDIRSEKVQEVKDKIKQGYYDSPEFADKLADKLIQDIGKDLGIT